MMWYWEGYHPTHTHERILPFGTMELTFNLTDEPMCFAYPEKGYRPHSLRGAIVSGVHSRFFVVETRRPASILSVLFEPGAAHQCFGIPAGELHNQHVPLRELWGSEADALYERLMTTSTIDERFSILERHLLERLQKGIYWNGCIERRNHIGQSALRCTPCITISAVLPSPKS